MIIAKILAPVYYKYIQISGLRCDLLTIAFNMIVFGP
jgi:hypothetical protein